MTEYVKAIQLASELASKGEYGPIISKIFPIIIISLTVYWFFYKEFRAKKLADIREKENLDHKAQLYKLAENMGNSITELSVIYNALDEFISSVEKLDIKQFCIESKHFYTGNEKYQIDIRTKLERIEALGIEIREKANINRELILNAKHNA